MNYLAGEDKFQEWVQQRITGTQGHFQDHRFSHQPNVPDLSASVRGKDYWLELKYAEFKLRHTKYDDFVLPTLLRGQLEWLKLRAKNGASTCGILAYFMISGDHSSPANGAHPYLFFMTASHYLQFLWKKKWSAGAIVLAPCAAAAHSISTGADLFRFIDEAAARPTRNAPPLRR